jgi:C1A family cysteine protease
MGAIYSKITNYPELSDSIQTRHYYGWKRDTSNSTDDLLQASTNADEFHNFIVSTTLDNIKLVDLRSTFPVVYNQDKLGSCTANAIAAAYEYDEIKQNEKDVFIPSRLFIYYNERKMEGSVDTDSGAEIRDGFRSIRVDGVCSEDMWKYDITKFNECPTQECYDDAKNHKSIEYKRVVQSQEQLKQCLIEGFPFVFGFNVYSSFETQEVAETGIMPIPKKGEELLGGHAVCAVGFDDNKRVFIVRNSWGDSWGDKGYFYMPYAFITNTSQCSDFWTVRKIKDSSPQTVRFDYSSIKEHIGC